MKLEDFAITFVIILGFISLCKNVLIVFTWLHSTFLRKPKDLRAHYGSWAAITGATDGIGKALAFDLASQGLNLVLIGRNPRKLEMTTNEITGREWNHRVQVKTVVIDFAKSSGEEIVRLIEEGTRGLDVGVLINNVGMSYPSRRYFHEVNDELIDSMLMVNTNAVVWMTRAVIPGMLKKKRGAIVNIGSGSSVYFSAFPLESVYASTKAFTATFSRSLSCEYEKDGIDVQCQVPLLISTKMSKMKPHPILVTSAETFSRASLRWIGHRDRVCNPFWLHSVHGFVIRTFDVIAVWFFFRYVRWLRRRALEKDGISRDKNQ